MMMHKQESFDTLENSIQNEITLRWILLNYNNIDIYYNSGILIAYEKNTKNKIAELHNIDYATTCMDVCVGEYLDIILSRIKKLYSVIIKEDTKAYAIVEHCNRRKEFIDYQIREVVLRDFSTFFKDKDYNIITYLNGENIIGNFIRCEPINKRLSDFYVHTELIFNLKEDAECALGIINQLDDINYNDIRKICRQCHSDLKQSSITTGNNLYIYDKKGDKVSTRLGQFKEEVYIKTKAYNSLIYVRDNETKELIESTYLVRYDNSNELVKQDKNEDIRVLYYQNKYYYKYKNEFVWPIMLEINLIK